jgi:hypothetical protein
VTATRVVNRRVERGTRYIGRMPGTQWHFGNPFSHQRGTLAKVRVGSREEAISRFRSWLKRESDLDVESARREWILANLHLLRDQVLECHCKPLDCHGDVYGDALEGRL